MCNQQHSLHNLTLLSLPPVQDSLGGVHGAHSSSGGSTSSLSTPPSVSHSPPQQPGQINGVGVALGAGGAMPSAMLGGAGAAGVPVGLMGALQGAQAGGGVLGMSGIVGALNGVIHTSGPALGQNASPLQQQQPHGTPTANIVTSGAMPINRSVAHTIGWNVMEQNVRMEYYRIER